MTKRKHIQPKIGGGFFTQKQMADAAKRAKAKRAAVKRRVKRG